MYSPGTTVCDRVGGRPADDLALGQRLALLVLDRDAVGHRRRILVGEGDRARHRLQAVGLEDERAVLGRGDVEGLSLRRLPPPERRRSRWRLSARRPPAWAQPRRPRPPRRPPPPPLRAPRRGAPAPRARWRPRRPRCRPRAAAKTAIVPSIAPRLGGNESLPLIPMKETTSGGEHQRAANEVEDRAVHRPLILSRRLPQAARERRSSARTAS